MRPKIFTLDVKKDDRGWLAEIIKANQIKFKQFGQIFVTVAKPGQTKGNHYHLHKLEWFCVIKGQGLLSLINNKTGQQQDVKMGDDNMVTVQITPHYFHSIKNTGSDDLYLLIYTNEVFNPQDPDTYYDRPFDMI